MKTRFVKQEYLVKIVLALVTLLIGLSAAIYLNNPLIGGISIALSYLTFRSAEKTSNIYGKTSKTKFLNSYIPNFIEFSALATTFYFNPEIFVSVIATAITGFYTVSKTETSNNISRKIYSLLDRTERVLILSLIFSASFFNPYLMLYGLIVLSGMILVDLVYVVYRFFS